MRVTLSAAGFTSPGVSCHGKQSHPSWSIRLVSVYLMELTLTFIAISFKIGKIKRNLSIFISKAKFKLLIHRNPQAAQSSAARSNSRSPALRPPSSVPKSCLTSKPQERQRSHLNTTCHLVQSSSPPSSRRGEAIVLILLGPSQHLSFLSHPCAGA